MKQNNKTLRIINILVGTITLAGLVFDFILFANIKGKMIGFLPLTQLESDLITVAGFSFLVILGFLGLSLLQVITTIRHSETLKFFLVALFVVGMAALLMVFADIALLSDIAKQYKAGWDQPEWKLLYPILIAQSIVVVVFLFLHLIGYFTRKQAQSIAVDSNIFLIVQFTGLLCALMGLVFVILGFIFQPGWSLKLHTILANLTLLAPYGLSVLYWFLVKIKEKGQPLYDEKQSQDVGRAAFLTLITVSVEMVLIYALNINALDGVLRYQWLPLYLFSAILVFSVSNLYFNKKG
jgi:hypothetical protein